MDLGDNDIILGSVGGYSPDPPGAAREMAEAREIWQPTPADPWGDLDGVAARLALEAGRLDAAEPFAAASVARWATGHSQRARTCSGIVLATIHVRADEGDGLELANGAITDVTRLDQLVSRAASSACQNCHSARYDWSPRSSTNR